MNELQKGAVYEVKKYLSSDGIKKRFEEILGKKAAQFMASIVNVVSGSDNLQKCDSGSIMSASFIAASFDLPIDQNLGFSAIVPYAGKAQFQMMYKGFIQLAMRSGQYRGMNYAEVYEDELQEYDPITKRVKFVYPRPVDGYRSKGMTDKIVGYFSWFMLINGFEQALYMTVEEIVSHATKYSKSFQYDLRDKKRSSKWTTDFDVMAKKTVIKLLLSKWGILSIDMQRAIELDQQVFDASGKGEFSDNPAIDDKTVKDPFAKPKEIPAGSQESIGIGLSEEEKQEIEAAERKASR